MTQLTLDMNCQLDTFSLSIKQALPLKGITGIYGHSGSGKSTLLRIIAGLNDQASGQISFDQEKLLDTNNNCFIKAENRQISMVFQDSRLFPHLTVLANLNFAVKRSTGKELDINEIIELTEIKPLLNTPVTKLSGGEQQRVALARAILVEPKLLLLDEPLSALDHASKNTLLSLLLKIEKQLNLPMFYISHSLPELQQVADNLLVLSSGKVQAYGDIHQVIHQLNHFDLTASGQSYQQTSLSLPVKSIDVYHQLVTLALGDHQEIHLPHSNYLKKQLIASHDVQKIRCFILASDISICLSEPINSSIVNQLFGKIIDIEQEKSQVLVVVECTNQMFFINISSYSLEKLALKKNLSVYLQFKASAVRSQINQ